MVHLTGDESIIKVQNDNKVMHMIDDDAQFNREVFKLGFSILYIVQMIVICFLHSFWYYEAIEKNINKKE